MVDLFFSVLGHHPYSCFRTFLLTEILCAPGLSLAGFALTGLYCLLASYYSLLPL
jgi:hypothetical protein